MSVLIHSNAEVFISKNSNLPIARCTQETVRVRASLGTTSQAR